MNFTKFDMGIIISMTIIIVFMSFTFPVMGLTTQNATNASDIPDFNISTSQFDFTEDAPERPSAPSKGILKWDQSKQHGGLDDRVRLYDDGTDIWTLNIVNNGTDSNTQIVTNLSYFVGNTDDPPNLEFWQPDTGSFDTVGQVETYDVTSPNANWTVEMELISLENVNQSNMTAEIDWQVYGQPPGGGESILDRTPIIGGILSTADAIGSFLGWIGSILWYFTVLIFEVVLNASATVYFSAIFFVELLSWLVSTYTGIVSGAPTGYISVVILIPGIALSVMFAKISVMLVTVIR